MKRLRPVLTFAAILLLLTACEAPTDSRSSESAQAALDHAAPGGDAVCKAAFGRHEAASEIVLDLDPEANEFPEGIAVDRRGNIYVGLRPTGQVLRFRPGKDPEVVTQFEAEDSGEGLLEDQGLLGLETDHRGNVYAAVAVAAFNPESDGQIATHGVWRISPDGDRELVPGTEAIYFPNALTFDPRGNLYISSSTGPPSGEDGFEDGGIWKVPPGGSAELWLRDEELTGTGEGRPIGANGIAHHPRGGGSLFVANSEKAQVVEVPIRPDGSPGAPEVTAELGTSDGLPRAPDGLAVDACGNLYPLLVLEGKLVRLSPDGSEMETLATREDGLQGATSLAFGSGKDARSVFIAEAALFTEERDPKVVKVDVGIPGASGR